MSEEDKSHEYQRNIISQILRDQIDLFYRQYDIEKYKQSEDEEKEKFITELKYWIKKFTITEELKISHISLKNALIKFTDIETFQHKMQLETVRILLPFLKSQLKLAQLEADREGIPKLRQDAVLPVGNTTVGEIILEIVEQAPRFVEFSREEQMKILNEAIQKTVGIYNQTGGTAYIMDTTTLNSLKIQQQKENEQKYKNLLKLNEEILSSIENTDFELSHKEKVKLQRRSVDVKLRMSEFEKWFKENNFPIPGGDFTKNNESFDLDKLSNDIIETRDFINAISKDKFGDRLLIIVNERDFLQLSREAKSEEEFWSRINSLANLVTKLNEDVLAKLVLQSESVKGSINLLEAYLKTLPTYNETPIRIFRAINKLRQAYPIHTDTVDGLQNALKLLGLTYPIENYNISWQKVLSAYFNALSITFQILKQS